VVGVWKALGDAGARYVRLPAPDAAGPVGRNSERGDVLIHFEVTDMSYFYDDLSIYHDFGGTVLAKEEGMNLARALGPKNKNIILQNHGYVELALPLALYASPPSPSVFQPP
jgi:hypothetical protein